MDGRADTIGMALHDNSACRGLKRPLADITASLNGDRRPDPSPKLNGQLWRRGIDGTRVPPPAFAGFSLATRDDDLLRLHSQGTHRQPVPFAVECARTCSLTAVADEVGCLHILDHRPDRADRAWRHLRSLQPHHNAVFALDWSADDRRIVLGSGDRYCSILDVQTGQVERQLRAHQSSVKAVRFAGDVLATGGRDGMVHLWDLRQQSPVATLQNAGLTKTQDTVTDLLFLPDGTVATAGAGSSTVRQWDMRQATTTKAMLRRALVAETPPGHDRGVTSLSLTKDGTRLLAVCKDSRVYEYMAMRLDHGQQRVWHLPQGSVSTFYCRAAISRDDVLCVGGDTGAPTLVDTTTTTRAVRVLQKAHAAECTDVAWAHDGEVCVTIGDDAAVRIWRAVSV